MLTQDVTARREIEEELRIRERNDLAIVLRWLPTDGYYHLRLKERFRFIYIGETALIASCGADPKSFASSNAATSAD